MSEIAREDESLTFEQLLYLGNKNAIENKKNIHYLYKRILICFICYQDNHKCLIIGVLSDQ